MTSDSSAPETPSVEVDIRVKFDDFSLDVSASFGAGITGIIGPSGAGKSTLLSCIAGLRNPDAGKIAVNGNATFDSESGVNASTDRTRAVLVHQHGNLFPHMTVGANIRYGNCARRKGGAPMGTEALASAVSPEEAAAGLGVSCLVDRYPDTLSGGERQRVAIARAIAAAPAVLLLDEPVAALDLRSRNDVVMYLKQLHERYQLPMVYVSHALSDVLALADETLSVMDGAVVGSGATREQVLAMATGSARAADSIDNVMFGKVAASDRVRVGGITVHTPPMASPAGADVAISIRASDLILATGQPSPSSARNVVRGTIEAIARSADVVLATVGVDASAPMVAELTPHSADELALAAGMEVYLVFKASSVLASGR